MLKTGTTKVSPLTVVFPLTWRSANTCLRGYGHEGLADCFLPALGYVESNSSGREDRVVRAAPVVLPNEVHHSVSDDLKTVWVTAL